MAIFGGVSVVALRAVLVFFFAAACAAAAITALLLTFWVNDPVLAVIPGIFTDVPVERVTVVAGVTLCVVPVPRLAMLTAGTVAYASRPVARPPGFVMVPFDVITYAEIIRSVGITHIPSVLAASQLLTRIGGRIAVRRTVELAT